MEGKKGKKGRGILLYLCTLILLITPISVKGQTFESNPKTTYAKEFIKLSEDETWFLNEVERVLNISGKTINTLESSTDLDIVTSIGLTEKNITGKIPKAIGELTQLRYLLLSKNNLSGELPDELYSLTNLKNLDLSENNFSGSINNSINNLSNLEILLLWGNDFSGAIPENIGELTNLTNLDLAKNNFNSVLPKSIGNLVNLKFCSLSNNELTGKIPEEISNLENLVTLLAWDNLLEGNIPDAFSNLKSLKYLDLSSNMLAGELPESLLNNESVEHISVSNNYLGRSLSETKLNLPAIKSLDLSNNKFTDDVSEDFILIQDGNTIVDLTYNFLSGENIKNINLNSNNLIDDFENQDKLSLSPKFNLEKNRKIYIYDFIVTRNISTNAITREKLKLGEADYKLTISPMDQNIIIGTDENGTYITVNLKCTL